MVSLVILSITKKDTLLFILISAGVGIEFYLIGFQVWYNTCCPYCLAFAAVIFILFALNYKRRSTFLSVASMALAAWSNLGGPGNNFAISCLLNIRYFSTLR